MSMVEKLIPNISLSKKKKKVKGKGKHPKVKFNQ